MGSDEEWGFYQYRAVLAVGLLFAGLLVYSLFDLVFLVLGREGTATVTEVYKLPARRGADYFEMEYKYKDLAGNERVGKYNLGETSDGAVPGDTFSIQYLPMWLLDAPDAARPKRPFSWIMLSLFVTVAAAFGFFAYRAIYHSEDGPRIVKRRR
jgi:hypothetical protein